MSAIGNPRFDPTPIETPVKPSPVAAPPEPAQGSPWKWLVLLAVVVVGVGGWLGYNKCTNAKAAEGPGALAEVRTAKVTTGPLERTIRISGPTSSQLFVNIVAPIMRGPESGREMILLFLLQSGTKVKKGDLIAKIDAKTLEDHIDDISDQIEAADADIRRRKAEHQIDTENLNQTIRVAKSELDKARVEARATEIRTPIDQELLKLAVEETEAKYMQSLADVAQKKITQDAELKILGITRFRHVRHQGRHKVDLTKFTIHAPMDGLAVAQTLWRSGEMSTIQQGDQVTIGQLFMKVVDPTKMQIEANVNQAESGLFRIGQKASIGLDAFPGLAMKGRIHSIAAIASGGWRQNYFIRNIPVRVAIEGSESRLIPDLSASADIVIAGEENVKKVPLAGIFADNGKEFVFVKTATGFAKREVEIETKNNTFAAISNGLNDGDEIALERPQGL